MDNTKKKTGILVFLKSRGRLFILLGGLGLLFSSGSLFVHFFHEFTSPDYLDSL